MSPRCASPSLFLPAVVLSSSSFLLSLFLSSPFLHSFILSLPELSTRRRRKTHNSDSPPPPLPPLSISLSLSSCLSHFVFHAHLDLRPSQRSGVWPLSSSREITDRCSSSVARADSSHRASRCEHQSLVKAWLLVVEIPMREGGRSPQCVGSSNRDEKPPSVASRRVTVASSSPST